MSGYANFRGRAKPKSYVPPRPNWTVEQRLDECLRIAELIEYGKSTPADEIALQAHLRVLKEAMPGHVRAERFSHRTPL